LIKIEAILLDFKHLGSPSIAKSKKNNPGGKELPNKKEMKCLRQCVQDSQAMLKFQLKYQNESEVVIETNQK
jgi:hypothetical protein